MCKMLSRTPTVLAHTRSPQPTTDPGSRSSRFSLFFSPLPKGGKKIDTHPACARRTKSGAGPEPPPCGTATVGRPQGSCNRICCLHATMRSRSMHMVSSFMPLPSRPLFVPSRTLLVPQQLRRRLFGRTGPCGYTAALWLSADWTGLTGPPDRRTSGVCLLILIACVPSIHSLAPRWGTSAPEKAHERPRSACGGAKGARSPCVYALSVCTPSCE